MKDDFLTLIRGALLHDIGKVVQRANENPTLKKHTEWGYEWLKENLQDDSVALAALAHHYTKDDDYAMTSNFGLIWYEADNLASAERKERERLEESKWHSEVAIASPFSRINNPNRLDEKPSLSYLPLKSNKKTIETFQKEPFASTEDYKEILKAFEKDINNPEIPKPPPVDFLLMVLEKHFSHIPSITMKIYDGLKKEEIKDKHPDISLYDHLKLTAAIAGCMYHYCSETFPEKWKNNELLRDEILNDPKDIKQKPYVLIGGDISGVQKFIYTITSKGALKSLKGRSFYLELLSEHTISRIIEALNLTRCNLIFSGGGHFYILSHNTPSSLAMIEKIKKEIDDYLFEEFKGNLQLHLVWEEFNPEEFKNTSELWGRLSNKLEYYKKKKWGDRLQDVLKVEMPHDTAFTRYCEVCFSEDIELRELKRGEDVVYGAICRSCKAQFELGEALKKISEKEFPVLYKFDAEPKEYTIKIDNAFYLLKTGWDKSIHLDAKAVYRINDRNAKHYSHPCSIYLPTGLYQHKKLDELVDTLGTFGVDRIGVLRMDLDNLGKIFSQAIPEDNRTFSRLASISRSFNNFFKYHLNFISEGREIDETTDVAERGIKNNCRMLAIVYSGGDDVFLIGHWLEVTEAAIDINIYFRKYTGNKFITISGGIAINHEKYPVYQYAREAEEAERLAKKDSKNAIVLFGNRRFKWDDIEKVLDRVRLFCRFLKREKNYLLADEDKLPKTFFYRLLALARRFKEDGVLILPKAAYLMSRARFGKGKDEDILKMKEVIMTANGEEWIITETATMWTLMMMKKGGMEDARPKTTI